MRTSINKKSDFDFIVLDNEGNAIDMPTSDFTLDLWTWGSKCRFRASSIGGVLKGCKNENGKLRVYVDNPGFVPGKLVGEWITYAESEDYADGSQRTCRYISDFGIDMVDGDSITNEQQVLAMMQYIQGASAYEIACEHGYQGTEEEWLNSLSLESVNAANECRELMAQLSAAEDERNANEQTRIANEQARVESEGSRSYEEDRRADAERTRIHNESVRHDREIIRRDAEEKRITHENSREYYEKTRQDNETARVTAEDSRVAAEKSRQEAEQTRATAEASRATAEEARERTHSGMKTAMREYADAESLREESEAERREAEQYRIEYEQSRQSAEANRLTNERSRATAESQRVTNETARKSAESSRVTAETARQEAETARQEAEQGRVTAEQQRADAEAARAEEFATFEGQIAAKEDVANKVKTLDADATDEQYPSAKAVVSLVYEAIEDKTKKMLVAEPYINLLNKDAVEDGKFLLNTGELASSSAYFVTEYIPAKPNTNYIGLYAGGNRGGAKGWCFFNANKKIITYYNSFGYCTTPEGTAYIRATGAAAHKDDAMIVEGTVIPDTYYPYQLAVSSDYMPNEIAELAKKVGVVLPNKMYFIKDKHMILYFDNFLFKPHKRKIQCIMSADALGVSRGDVFYGTPSSAGSGTITIKQVLENYKSFSDSLSYQIINPATKSGQTLNVMCVGDSFTDLGHYVSEIYHQLTDNGIACNLIGTSRGGASQDDTYRHEGLSGGNLNKFLRTNCGAAVIVDVTGMTNAINTTYGGTTYEDTNGVKWSARGFRVDESGNGKLMLGIYKAETADTYEESINFPSAGILTKLSGDGAATLSYTNKQIAYFNPFWNPSTNALDFSYYINLWGYNAPDLMVLQFTFNDVGEWAAIGDIESFISGIKSVADVFHTNYPSAKLVFSIEPQGSLLPSAFNIDARHYGFMRFAKMLYNAIENDGNYNTWMRVAPSYAGVDRINGYMSKEVALCPRYPNVLTKTTSGDTTHPNVNGMKQIADMIVPVIYSLL